MRLRRMITLAALLCPLASIASPPPWATGESRGEDLTLSLVTFGRGDEVISWFGHGAIAVEDKGRKHGRLYNYGMFSFDDKMLFKFAMGRLEFWVGEASIAQTYQYYREDNRDVR